MDLTNEVKSGLSLVPVARTASGNGTGIDFNDCDKTVYVDHVVGNAASSDLSSIITVEESDDNSTFTAITGSAQTAVGGSGDNAIYSSSVVRTKRYVRAVNTIAGTSPTITSAVVLRAKKLSY